MAADLQNLSKEFRFEAAHLNLPNLRAVLQAFGKLYKSLKSFKLIYKQNVSLAIEYGSLAK